MADNKLQSVQSLSTKQKATVVVFVIVIAVIIWQAWGLMGGGGTGAPDPAKMSAEKPTMTAEKSGMTGASATQPPSSPVGAPNQTTGAASIPSRENELIRLQRETQEKYLAAINELQMLKLSREIAETTQGIASAKLATVTAEKSVLDLFTKAPPPVVPVSSYASSLASPGSVGAVSIGSQEVGTTTSTEASYIVLSVSYLVNKWNAVMGYQGKLYNVAVGDVLPPDGSAVISISKAGVILRKDGATKKVSLVSAI